MKASNPPADAPKPTTGNDGTRAGPDVAVGFFEPCAFFLFTERLTASERTSTESEGRENSDSPALRRMDQTKQCLFDLAGNSSTSIDLAANTAMPSGIVMTVQAC